MDRTSIGLGGEGEGVEAGSDLCQGMLVEDVNGIGLKRLVSVIDDV